MLLCLDYDGVLVDSFDVLLDMMRDAQFRLGGGRPPTAEDLRTIESLAFPDLGRRLGLTDAEIERYASELMTMQERDWEVKLFPGILDAVERLSRRHTVVVVTASQGHAVAGMLARSGAGEAVAEVLGGELGESKASRIARLCSRYGYSRRKTVMVGDAISDIRQGKAAGVRTAAVAWGYQDRELLLRECPDTLIETPGELARLPELM